MRKGKSHLYKINILALFKVIESYNEKSGKYIFFSKAIHSNKDNCDQNLKCLS